MSIRVLRLLWLVKEVWVIVNFEIRSVDVGEVLVVYFFLVKEIKLVCDNYFFIKYIFFELVFVLEFKFFNIFVWMFMLGVIGVKVFF